MQHEHTVANLFSSLLINLGYTTNDPGRRRWNRDNKTVIVCLADDFNICGADLSRPPKTWYNDDTIVITDNHVMFQPQYKVIQLPTSYFGVFNYTPANQDYNPTCRFNFSVNRLDAQRELILFELINQTTNLESVLQQDYINFNCRDTQGANNTVDDIKFNFLKYWAQLSRLDSMYTSLMEQVVDAVPIKNHNLSVEQAHVSAWLVPVIETYSGNDNIAFSEKIFRALVTPVPWTVYSATGAVEYLKTLGFDVLDDLVDHEYNNVHQDAPYGLKKIKAYIKSSIDMYDQLKTGNFDQIKARCLQAAQHNQQVLTQLQQQWPRDFANWLPKVVEQLI
jgi:hypothetical protein